MAPRIKLLVIFLSMAFLSCVRCNMRNNLIEFGSSSLRHNLIEETTSGDRYVRDNFHFQAYPSYFDMFENGKSKSFLKKNTNILTLGRVSNTQSKSIKKVSVTTFGAKGNGNNDDTKAFEKAWATACPSTTGAIIVVPKGNYLLQPISFSGPCKSTITFQILGTIQASDDRSDYKGKYWILFQKVENLFVEGGGTIDGNGNIWWKNSCKINKKLPCKNAPTALTFYNSKNLVVTNLNIKDAQQIQLSFENCENVEASFLTITAPEESPNTDGIHVTNTQNIRISNSVIGTGDDCISIVSGSKNVQAMDITCGPGHGISIGSLGKNNAEDYVSGVIVNQAKLRGTKNGVRIKTWQGGSGIATNITFQNIEMENVYNPIIIDQNYCDNKGPCKPQKKAVQVKNILYKGIKGTSASDVAIKFDCSKAFPCQGVVLQNIELDGEEGEAKASCTNIKLQDIGEVSPRC